MKSRIKIIHWIVFLWLVILVTRIELMLDYLLPSTEYISLLFSEPQLAIAVLNFRMVDSVLSTMFFLLIIPLGFIFRKRLSLLKNNLSFSIAFLILLSSVFLFAPVISNENTEFSKNLSVTKLLPPFSSIKQIELKPTEGESLSEAEIFRQKIDRIIKPPFNNNIIFADSVEIAKTVIYYQKKVANKISADRLLMQDGTPIVKEKLFVFGTDEFGRDLFVRILYGTRISLIVGLGSVILCFIIGTVLGFIAGYKGGILDILLNRFSEIFLAFPVIYLVVLILGLFGSSIFSVIVVLGISGWMSLFKIVKSEVLSIKQKDYFSTAELVGLRKSQLLLKEVLPVSMAPVLVNLVFLFSNVVLAEAALSYLGLGTGNAYPSWGSMISSGQEYITKAWWLIALPGAGLILTLFSINSSGKMLGRILNPGMK